MLDPYNLLPSKCCIQHLTFFLSGLALTPIDRGSDCAPSTPRPRASGGMAKSGAALHRASGLTDTR
jgi:hypothetical protein